MKDKIGVPEELAGVDWYKATPEQRAALAKFRAFIPDEIYPEVQGWMNSFTADFIVTRTVAGQDGTAGKKEFLVLRRAQAPWKGGFSVFGGRIRPLETPHQACIRNVKRETSLAVSEKEIRFAGFVPCLNPDSQDGGAPWFSTWCLFEVPLPMGAEIKLDEHGIGFQWFTEIQLDFHEELKQGLRMIGFSDSK